MRVYNQPPPQNRNQRFVINQQPQNMETQNLYSNPYQGQSNVPEIKDAEKGKNKRPIKQVNQRPWWADILDFLIYIANSAGQFLISNKFVNLIQDIFDSHIEVLNYVIRNFKKKEFWYKNFMYGSLLFFLLLLKEFVFQGYLNKLIILGISIFCLLTAKFYDLKGLVSIKIISPDLYTNNEEEKKEEYDSKNKEDRQEMISDINNINNESDRAEQESNVNEEEKTAKKSPFVLKQPQQPYNPEGLGIVKPLKLKNEDTTFENPSRDLTIKALQEDKELATTLNMAKFRRNLEERVRINNLRSSEFLSERFSNMKPEERQEEIRKKAESVLALLRS